MTTAEDIQEYIEELKANYATRKQDTYKDTERTFNWLFLERMTIIDGYNVDDFTEEQFMFIDDVFDELINDNQAKALIKRNEWNHSSER